MQSLQVVCFLACTSHSLAQSSQTFLHRAARPLRCSESQEAYLASSTQAALASKEVSIQAARALSPSLKASRQWSMQASEALTQFRAASIKAWFFLAAI